MSITILLSRSGRIYDMKRVAALRDILEAAFAAGDEKIYFAAARELEKIELPIEVSIDWPKEGKTHVKK